ncbi:MAG: xanthine dehydrogenase family protein molybdopterin-binding subunit [Synergistaceae bacterium]|nr:xanthine dehydrogenase family protein molybdopterin-binding subunit [Synergistaceae bacterium]
MEKEKRIPASAGGLVELQPHARKLMKNMNEKQVKKYIGNSIPKVDAAAKASGRAKYAGDLVSEGGLHICLVRSSLPNARIVNIDASPLHAMGGVFYFTGNDFAENSIGNIMKDQPALATEKVRFFGEPVAVVAAPSLELARHAASLVRIEYEPLPVVDLDDAIAGTAVKLHEPGNLLSDLDFSNGDVEEALSKSDLVLSDTFTMPFIEHAYMETEGGICWMDKNGNLCLRVSTQNPYADRAEISHALNIPEDKIHVEAGVVGGGFGGKDGNTVQVFLALVTYKTGRPSRLVFSREESMIAGYKRHSARTKVTVGFSAEGEITAFSGAVDYDTGAYAALGPAVASSGFEHFAGPYSIKNVKLRARLWYTNKPPASAMRGFGIPQTLIAIETLLNRASKQLGIDPIELRRRNALTKEAFGTLGQKMRYSVAFKEVLTLLEKSPLWAERLVNENSDIGYAMAAGYQSIGMGRGIPDEAEVTVEENGNRYLIRIGTVDIGQGTMTLFAQLAAEELGVPLDLIDIIMGDTARTRYCGSTAASRTSYICGNALFKAIRDYKRNKENGVVRGVGKSIMPEELHPSFALGMPHAIYSFIGHVVKIKIDRTTDMIKVLEVYTASDTGRVVNPVLLEGQIEGGVAMGIGYALMEQVRYSKGAPLEDSLFSYVIPSALDAPIMKEDSVDSYEDSSFLGVKGVAEIAVNAVAPAILSAVENIAGAQLNSLPIKLP